MENLADAPKTLILSEKIYAFDYPPYYKPFKRNKQYFLIHT